MDIVHIFPRPRPSARYIQSVKRSPAAELKGLNSNKWKEPPVPKASGHTLKVFCAIKTPGCFTTSLIKTASRWASKNDDKYHESWQL